MKNKTNVAPSSVEGHFIENAKDVINLDSVNETFFVESGKKTILSTKNHTELEISEDCLITCQKVYNPFSKMFEKSKD